MKQLYFVAATLVCLLAIGPFLFGQGRQMPGDADPTGVTGGAVTPRMIATQRFQVANPGADVFRVNDRVRRVYGRSFSRAETPQQSAEQFLQEHAAIFGVARDNLKDAGPFPDGRHVQPIMYDPETESYKFTGLYYTQHVDDVPVFRSRLTLLTRNEAEYPLVLASSDLRDLGGFRVTAQALAQADVEAARTHVLGDLALGEAAAAQAQFDQGALVVWAGVDDEIVEPRLAVEQTVQIGSPSDPDTYQKWLYLVDAATGDVLYRENQIVHASVDGNVSCLCTSQQGAAVCSDAELRPMPYTRVVVDGQVTFADENGNYSVEGVGPGNVTVSSDIRGQYFRVFSANGNAVLGWVQNIDTPGTADFIHNVDDAEEYTRAAVDAYNHSNVVRDFALTYNPDYPVIANQTEFTINVNLSNNCNAFYDGNSVNYYTSGGGCANTAFDSVVYHEYGHHLVNVGGSGQGAYGEGMSDTIGMLITENPILGLGFENNCSAGIRTADNDLQYPCSGGIHHCGQLISGCVYDTLLELQATGPTDEGELPAKEILANLTVNSILLHTGTSIDPSITIDFLTLDDDDDDIFNGTPHYNQINAGFSAHNMDGPEIDQLQFIYPDGLPELIAPNTSASFVVQVDAVAGTPQSGTGMLHYRVGTSGPFSIIPLTEIGPDLYEGTLPGQECGTPLNYFVSAQTTEGETQTNPREAPDVTYAALSAADLAVVFADDFDDDLNWIVGALDDDAATGHWERVDPVGTSSSGGAAQPDTCHTGPFCYVTGQHPGGGAGANDVDNGKTTLHSPLIDLDGAFDATINYWRWYSNHAGASPYNDVFIVDITNDGGQSWVNVETVGPAGPQVEGGWYHNEFLVSEFVEPTDQVQVRFVASDYDPQALIEAAVDAFRVNVIECDAAIECVGDLDGDGAVDSTDLLDMLAAWGPCVDCTQDLNGDGEVNVTDLLELLSAWGECPN